MVIYIVVLKWRTVTQTSSTKKFCISFRHFCGDENLGYLVPELSHLVLFSLVKNLSKLWTPQSKLKFFLHLLLQTDPSKCNPFMKTLYHRPHFYEQTIFHIVFSYLSRSLRRKFYYMVSVPPSPSTTWPNLPYVVSKCRPAPKHLDKSAPRHNKTFVL